MGPTSIYELNWVINRVTLDGSDLDKDVKNGKVFPGILPNHVFQFASFLCAIRQKGPEDFPIVIRALYDIKQ